MNTERSADEAAVRALYQQLIDGWNEGSGEAFALPFAEDGDLVAFDGTHFKGRSEIVPFHQQLFQTYLKGTRLVGNVKDVRVLNNDCPSTKPNWSRILALLATKQDFSEGPTVEHGSSEGNHAWLQG